MDVAEAGQSYSTNGKTCPPVFVCSADHTQTVPCEAPGFEVCVSMHMRIHEHVKYPMCTWFHFLLFLFFVYKHKLCTSSNVSRGAVISCTQQNI